MALREEMLFAGHMRDVDSITHVWLEEKCTLVTFRDRGAGELIPALGWFACEQGGSTVRRSNGLPVVSDPVDCMGCLVKETRRP